MDASLHDTQGEMLITLTSQGPMTRQLHFPAPFASSAGQSLVVPLNEGISYPVDDPSIPRGPLPTYGGPLLSMPFAGVTDGNSGYMAIIETPNDALIRLTRPAELGSVVAHLGFAERPVRLSTEDPLCLLRYRRSRRHGQALPPVRPRNRPAQNPQ